MKQLKLPLEWIDCRYYNDCDAPLCPQDVNLKQCLWFPREPICRLRNAPEWVRRQRKIARLRDIDPDKYFTVRMLIRLEQIRPGLQGADPELVTGERLWAARHLGNLKITGTPSEDRQRPGSESGTYPLF